MARSGLVCSEYANAISSDRNSFASLGEANLDCSSASLVPFSMDANCRLSASALVVPSALAFDVLSSSVTIGFKALMYSVRSKVYPPHGRPMCRRPQFVNGDDVMSISPFPKCFSNTLMNSCNTCGWHPTLMSSTCFVPMKFSALFVWLAHN